MSTVPGPMRPVTNDNGLWKTEEGRTLFKIRGTRLKWGYVVYRTTYLNDTEWERVKQIITQTATKLVGIPELLNYMEWIFVDDKTSLNGASRASLRNRFRAWADGTARDLGHDLDYFELDLGHSRLCYFIEVDEASLRSIIDNSGMYHSGLSVQGHVNFVDALWEPGKLEFEYEEDRLLELEWQKQREPIDNCREHIVGWKMVKANGLSAGFQEDMDALLQGDMWDRMYTRPPEVCSNW